MIQFYEYKYYMDNGNEIWTVKMFKDEECKIFSAHIKREGNSTESIELFPPIYFNSEEDEVVAEMEKLLKEEAAAYEYELVD